MTLTEREWTARLIYNVRTEIELKMNANVMLGRMMLVLSATAWGLLARAGQTGVFDEYNIRTVVERDGKRAFEIVEIKA